MFQKKAKIIYNKIIKDNYFSCLLDVPRMAGCARPGQFLQVKVGDNYEPLLRRPFSIHNVDKGRVEIIYEVLGQGTEVLSQKKAGESLSVIGPLGNGFDYSGKQAAVLVAGGMGVAPLLFLAKKITPSKIIVFIGAKSKKQILCEKEFHKLGCGVKIATDDGSCGFKGKVTQLLNKFLDDNKITGQQTMIYACGPRPMLKEISKMSKNYKIPAQISLEEHMACGIGACFGCVVNTGDGLKRVCKEGPVFAASRIIWP